MNKANIAEVSEKLTKGEAANIITRLKHGAQVCPTGSLYTLYRSNMNYPGISREKDKGASQRVPACRKRETPSSTQHGASWTTG